MYILKINGKVYTLPDANLTAFAYVQATDRKIPAGVIDTDDKAIKFLQNIGFEISKTKDPEELTEIPQCPNYNNPQHRDLYNRLFYHDIGRELTPEEDRFCKSMYHMEEFACGLDG